MVSHSDAGAPKMLLVTPMVVLPAIDADAKIVAAVSNIVTIRRTSL